MNTSVVDGLAPAQPVPQPLVIAGVPVDRVLVDELPDIVERMLENNHRNSTDFRRLPPEFIRDEVLSISSAVVRLFARWLRDGATATPRERDRLAESAGRRAEEGMPVGVLLAGYCHSLQSLFQQLSAPAGPQDLDAVRELGVRLFDCVREVMMAAAGGYVEDVRQRTGAEQDTKQVMLSALLSDNAPPAADVPASRYLVLNLTVGRHSDELHPGVNTTIVTRRVLRRLTNTFAAASDGEAMASLTARGGIVLIPAEKDVSWARWTEIVEAAGRAAGVQVTAAGTVAAPDRIRAAAAQNTEVLDVLRWFERPPGLYRLDDVLVEYQLTRPGPARRHLAAVLEPLDRYPELAETLTCYLDNNQNRRRTATRLNVHPNTIDYRLRRIAEVTGLNLTEPSGTHRAMAALAARRAETPPMK
ncbi:PucR family transcriptional regulator [Amycolatopsis sp. NPDC088138]|uniref:PucR family transcriptional regulator n=1 Tax=Amycolatopsis sp. NPDC088138 TaxID=3363938 RepID=UPI00381B1084